MGVASGCGEQEVGVASECVESMGVATGCGCKEVYRFPHTTYLLLLLYLFFFTAASPFFVNFLKCFLFLFTYIDLWKLAPISQQFCCAW